MRSGGIWTAEIMATACRYFGKHRCYFVQIGYAFNMAKRNSETDRLKSFCRLLQEVTTRLVGAQSAEIDIAVDDCLAKLGEHFHVSQVGLGQWSKSGKILPSLRTWGDKPVSDYLTTVGPGPEAFAYFCRKGSLTWNCLEDLEELPQLQEHARQVRAMAGAFWLHRNFGTYTHQVSGHSVGRHWRSTA